MWSCFPGVPRRALPGRTDTLAVPAPGSWGIEGCSGLRRDVGGSPGTTCFSTYLARDGGKRRSWALGSSSRSPAPRLCAPGSPAPPLPNALRPAPPPAPPRLPPAARPRPLGLPGAPPAGDPRLGARSCPPRGAETSSWVLSRLLRAPSPRDGGQPCTTGWGRHRAGKVAGFWERSPGGAMGSPQSAKALSDASRGAGCRVRVKGWVG